MIINIWIHLYTEDSEDLEHTHIQKTLILRHDVHPTRTVQTRVPSQRGSDAGPVTRRFGRGSRHNNSADGTTVYLMTSSARLYLLYYSETSNTRPLCFHVNINIHKNEVYTHITIKWYQTQPSFRFHLKKYKILICGMGAHILWFTACIITWNRTNTK